MTVTAPAETARTLAGVRSDGDAPLPARPAAPGRGKGPDDSALARYRVGLEEVGRLLGWTGDTTAAFAEVVTACPWAECGWAECDTIAAAYRAVLDRCEAPATRRWSGGAPDAGGLPLDGPGASHPGT